MSWVGDGNNIIHSLMMAAPRLGVNMRIATPKVTEHLRSHFFVFYGRGGTTPLIFVNSAMIFPQNYEYLGD